MTHALTFRRVLFAGAAAVLVTACGTQPVAGGPAYVVTFTSNSDALDAPAHSVIANAAEAARADTDRAVLVARITAPATPYTAGSDVILAGKRSQAVTNALVAQGVALSRITQQARGSTGNDLDAETRRVEIVLGL